MEFKYHNKIYPIEITRKRGQKNTYIRVKKDLVIHVTTSLLTTKFSINKLIKDNTEKIYRMIDVINKKCENNDGFYYLGKKYNINYIDENKLYFDNDNVYIGREYDIDNFYKKEAKKLFLERLEYHYDNYTRRIPHPKLKIRKMTTRWGVCNIKSHNITLNLELMKRDIRYLDYVIVHELTHLVHGDHSNSFWKVVEENYPEYKKVREEMKTFL